MTKATTIDRGSFLEQLSNWNKKVSLTLALCDIDQFDPINTNYGHETGDKVIALVMKALEGSLPEGTFLARIGGDEFAAGFPAATPEEALIQLEEIRHYLSSKKHALSEGVSLPIQVSMGIASFPQHVSDPKELIGAADEALLRAKREGRGRVTIYVEDRMTLKSNYYPKAQLARLSALSERLGRTEAALLREALGDLLGRYRGEL
ncbi:MAG: GGDEF domain-containing protein [Thermaceae bacterium]|nr:GGDEF domain-containing protein [Thermaceae bacterium]